MKKSIFKTALLRLSALCLFLVAFCTISNAQTLTADDIRATGLTAYEGIDVPAADRPAINEALTLYLEAKKADAALAADIAADNEIAFPKLIAELNAKRNDLIAAGENTVAIDQEIKRIYDAYGKAKTESGSSSTGSGSSSSGGY